MYSLIVLSKEQEAVKSFSVLVHWMSFQRHESAPCDMFSSFPFGLLSLNSPGAQGKCSSFHTSAQVSRLLSPIVTLTLSQKLAGLPSPDVLQWFKSKGIFRLFFFPLLLLLWWLGQNHPFELEILIQSKGECYSRDSRQRGEP